MRRLRLRVSLYLLTAGIAVLVASHVAASAPHPQAGAIDLFVAEVSADGLEALQRRGLDVVEVEALVGPVVADVGRDLDPAAGEGHRAYLLLSPYERALLESEGVTLEAWRDEDGRTAAEGARLQQQAGFEVWRPFDGEGGIREEIYAIAAEHPELVDLQVIGSSVQGREIIALKVTKDAGETTDGSRPGVLYLSMHHAREWISLEVNRRLLLHFLEGYGQDEQVTELVDTRELWFVLVGNPDGYQYTHEAERFWRKNLRDNDGDGQITNADGVDLNRNYDARWGYDNEGSSTAWTSNGYRGPEPGSEPETKAAGDLLLREELDLRFMVTYHSSGNMLLYGVSWQEETRQQDDPVSLAFTGTNEEPGVEGYRPVLVSQLGANGDFGIFAYEKARMMWFAPELTSGYGFDFPDNEELIQNEFEINLPFALDLAASAADPGQPITHIDNLPEPFYVDDFPISYGDPQPVQVNAARHLGAVTMQYRIDDGIERAVATHAWNEGERYDDLPGLHYQYLRGEVVGAEPGQRVTVWFEAGGAQSEPFSYTVAADSDADVLVVAAEDYSGWLPGKAEGADDGPKYAQVYLEALAANGYEAALYDMDAHERLVPDPLGVLGHFDTVIWYTGDDIVPREAGHGPGTVSRSAQTMKHAMRDYLNQGGRLLLAGPYAGMIYGGAGVAYDPVANADCAHPEVGGCSGFSDDFRQYYLGANSHTLAAPWDYDRMNLAGEGKGLWSGGGNNADRALARDFDLSVITGTLELALESHWLLQTGADFGYVEVSTDGGAAWASLPDLDGHLSEADAGGGDPAWGLTGAGTERLRFDLSAYAGITETLGLRLRFASNQNTGSGGWWIDDLVLDNGGAVVYANDFESDYADWANGGWGEVPAEPPSDVVLHPVVGAAPPFDGLTWRLGGPEAATAQSQTASFVPTSNMLPPEDFPRFESWTAGWSGDPARMPRSGDRMAYSGQPARTHQRLTRQVDLSGVGAAGLRFWISHDLWAPWDSVFVEARTPGEEDWTTLAEVNGHTSPDAGRQCANEGWFGSFPHLAHYMTRDTSGAEVECLPSGESGAWFAATGSSDGWQEWSFDLSAYAGAEVEVSIAYVRWGTGASAGTAGVMIDDVSLSTDALESFEDGLGDWTVGMPAGMPAQTGADFSSATFTDFPAGPVVVTEDTIYLGFGLEAVATEDERNAVMERAMGHLHGVGELDLPIYLPSLMRE